MRNGLTTKRQRFCHIPDQKSPDRWMGNAGVGAKLMISVRAASLIAVDGGPDLGWDWEDESGPLQVFPICRGGWRLLPLAGPSPPLAPRSTLAITTCPRGEGPGT